MPFWDAAIRNPVRKNQQTLQPLREISVPNTLWTKAFPKLTYKDGNRTKSDHRSKRSIRIRVGKGQTNSHLPVGSKERRRAMIESFRLDWENEIVERQS